jgi:diguanylate cyclase (GGDEF)-like protein
VGAEETKPFPTVERRRNAGADTPEKREAGEVAVFQELGKALTSSLQLDQVLRTIMEKIDEFLRPDNWSLLLLDEAKQELYFELAVGKASQALKDVRVKMGQGIAGWVAEHGEVVIVPDTSKDTRFFAKVDEKTKMETRSIVAVPVMFRDTCLGVIELINCMGPDGFDAKDLKLLEALSDFAAIALENARHVKRIHELTIKDDCTSLYNARHMGFILDTEIYRSQRYNYEFSIVFIDLDHFKLVNDTHGHLVGSRLLAEIGEALKTNCRLIDFAFRYGGDEFVILLPQTSKENAINVAKRLHKLVRETVWLAKEGLNIMLTPSLGLAAYPADSKSKEGLLHLADEAMYLVKNSNRDSVAAANMGILPPMTAEEARGEAAT